MGLSCETQKHAFLRAARHTFVISRTFTRGRYSPEVLSWYLSPVKNRSLILKSTLLLCCYRFMFRTGSDSWACSGRSDCSQTQTNHASSTAEVDHHNAHHISRHVAAAAGCRLSRCWLCLAKHHRHVRYFVRIKPRPFHWNARSSLQYSPSL